ncbi:protein adenylyltransferase SelO [Salipaludibacillus sp. HK11]|uniref:protein adenylyltransferase SelO n=1 Tax=Salipaludibacillus sp. HK11 TaxID=3394320 RepID=UPI0039FCDCFE
MSQRNGTTNAGWNLENSYAGLSTPFFTKLELNPVSEAKLIFLNRSLATSLGLNVEELESEDGVDVLAGNQVPEGSVPIAQAYAGHQFGNFTMLGDGRALLIGEQVTPDGKRFDLQLKGSGRTPYSRGGDGRAALGPMLREYIISEAMYALDIPTNRSLAVVTTGEPVIRETNQPGAVLTRVASSHIRVGTFEYASQLGTVEDLQVLADYTLQRHYPDFDGAENRYHFLLQEVIKRQAELVAKWNLVGFIHGVMNTDNMAISGESIDFGPCAFMNTYDPSTVFSSIDVQGRYAYGNQPYIAGWNLARFAETLLPLLHDNQEEAVKLAQEEISGFSKLYLNHWLVGMRGKLGIFNEQEDDKSLIEDLLTIMQKYRADYTNTFIALTFDKAKGTELFESDEFAKWNERWQTRLNKQQLSNAAAHELMRNSNPAVIPRNHRVEDALEAVVERGDYSVMGQLLDILSKPYAHTSAQADFAEPPADLDENYQTFCGT